MKTHLKVLAYLLNVYGSRDKLARLLGTTGQAIYFWQYREEIPAQFHGIILALHEEIEPEQLIADFETIYKISRALRLK